MVRVITVTLVVCCGEGDNSYIGGVLWRGCNELDGVVWG